MEQTSGGDLIGLPWDGIRPHMWQALCVFGTKPDAKRIPSKLSAVMYFHLTAFPIPRLSKSLIVTHEARPLDTRQDADTEGNH